MQETDVVAKWMWMSDYCRNMLWNPHDSYFWQKAEEEYQKKVTNIS